MATFTSNSTNTYELSFGGIPLLLDFGRTIRLAHSHAEQESDTCNTPPRKYQPLEEIISELDRLMPFQYLQDFHNVNNFLGRNTAALARQEFQGPYPCPEIKINSWFYPPGATRWSVFRGLATSSAVKEILKIAEPFLLLQDSSQTTSTLRTFQNRDQAASFTSTNTSVSRANASAKFVMLANPNSPDNPSFDASLYRLESNLFLLPPRPLAEHGGQFDGLYLITLVDERYWWQYSPISLQINKDSQWDDLLDELAVALGITLVSDDTLPVYGQPEPDSQLWTNFENAGVLLDAVAYNTGRVVVRLLNGTYVLRTSQDSQAIVQENRNTSPKLVRTAGGDMFYSGNMSLKAGDLSPIRNAVVPDFVNVTFPIYIAGDDPVPHFSNPRYQNQRPSAWYEESFGEVYTIPVPITSGGTLASGLLGTSGYTHSLHDVGKAYLSGEIASVAFNHSGLTALSMHLAGDYYDSQLAAALDETYPGTLAWIPEGIHDIVWTYSARVKQATTRVLKTQWNQQVREFQHTTPYLTGYSQIPKGVGGPSVAQSIRDQYSGQITTSIGSDLSTTALSVQLQQPDYLPTQNRWRGKIDNEIMLLEGTSGMTSVNIVYRGIDGTLPVMHTAGTQLKQIVPNVSYGVNLTSYEKGQFVYPAEWTSGGIQGINIVPQVQSVNILDSVGRLLNGIRHYSGQINTYDSSKSSPWNTNEFVWAVERNNATVTQGSRYDGQLVGYSAAPVAPVYAIGEPGTSTSTGTALEIKELDGSPDIPSVNLIILNQDDGYQLIQPNPFQARFNFQDVSTIQKGAVNIDPDTVQFLGQGDKAFNDNLFFSAGNSIFWALDDILTNKILSVDALSFVLVTMTVDNITRAWSTFLTGTSGIILNQFLFTLDAGANSNGNDGAFQIINAFGTHTGQTTAFRITTTDNQRLALGFTGGLLTDLVADTLPGGDNPTMTEFTSSQSITVANTTTPSSLIPNGTGSMVFVGGLTIPANFFTTGKTLRLKAKGFYSAQKATVGGGAGTVGGAIAESAVAESPVAGGATGGGGGSFSSSFDWQIKLGTTTLLDTRVISSTTDETNQMWEIEAEMCCYGTGITGSICSQGNVERQCSSNAFLNNHPMTTTTPATVDSTTSQTLDLIFTWGAASAMNSITTTNFSLEGLN